jgi:hypothetical protein
MSGKQYQDSKKNQVPIHSEQKVQNKMTQTNESQKDVFSVYTKSFDKLKSAFERTSTQSLQSYTTLNQEILSTWSSFIHTVASIQQNFANKVGVNASLPETSAAVIQDATDAFVKAVETNSKVVQTALDATVQNIKTVNQNTNAFAELNQNIINSWISAWKPRN